MQQKYWVSCFRLDLEKTNVPRLHAIGSSTGIAIGRAYVMTNHQRREESAVERTPEAELAEFRAAKGRIEQELTRVAQRARQNSPTLASIVETHAMIVSDPIVANDIENRIGRGESAVDAVNSEFGKQVRLMMLSTNSLIRDRATDLEHVQEHLIAELQSLTTTDTMQEPMIVVAKTLTPADMYRVAQQGALGFLVEEGGVDSHISIIARDLGLPAIVSLRTAVASISAGANVIIDAYGGFCIIDPTETELDEYRHRLEKDRARLSRERTPIRGVIATSDGTEIHVLANVDTPQAAQLAHEYQAHGIGLVRTEMMLSGDGSFPTGLQQQQWYASILNCCSRGSVTFRAFDIGGDKFGSYSPYTEQNPVLGLRGIRFLLAQPRIFEEQVKAILRVAQSGRTKLMLPMITSYAEIIAAREIIDACKVEIEDERNMLIDLPVGVMIETPAAAVMSDVLSQYVDFISIGTNDLTQYTLAADRTNELVSNMFDCIHPSVIRLMRMIVDASSAHNIDISVCGEMAAQLTATDVLLGIGLRQLSVTPHVIPELQRRVQHISIERCKRLVTELVDCRTSQDVRAKIIEHQAQD